MDPAVVIGAGPYGLATAAHLKAKGIPVRIFGEPLASWRHHMPNGMILKSMPAASSISSPYAGYTLQDFCDRTGRERLEAEHQVVPIETFVSYGLWYQERLVPEVERVEVVSVSQQEGAWELKLDSGEQLRAGAVVVATGLHGLAHLPETLASAIPEGPSPDGPISHTFQHDDLIGYAGRDLLVIGGGQSALESAALLREAGAQVRLLVRGPRVGFGSPPTTGRHWKPNAPVGRGWGNWAVCRWPAAFRFLPAPARIRLVGTILGPSGGWWLRNRVADRIPVETNAPTTGARLDGHRAVITTSIGARTVEHVADDVVAATGYRVDLRALGFLAPETRAALAAVGGAPRLDATLQSSARGLYFTGLPAAATFGPLLRFVCGTEFAAPRVARAVAASL